MPLSCFPSKTTRSNTIATFCHIFYATIYADSPLAPLAGGDGSQVSAIDEGMGRQVGNRDPQFTL